MCDINKKRYKVGSEEVLGLGLRLLVDGLEQIGDFVDYIGRQGAARDVAIALVMQTIARDFTCVSLQAFSIYGCVWI